MEDQLKRWNRADSSRRKDETISEGRESIAALGEESEAHLQVSINCFGELSGGIFDVAALCFIMHAMLNQTNR